VDELREAKLQLEQIRQELAKEGKPMAEKIPLGIMLETPAAALSADRLAKECDFFSIGTNDLIQYSLAIDRGNREVAYLYRPLHLGVLRLIQSAVAGAKAAGIEVAMCGEMAGDPLYALVLLALGLDNLSVNPADIPKVKRVIRGASLEDAQKVLADAMCFTSHHEIEQYVLTQMQTRFPFLNEGRELAL
jgi:phosphotransferase system enzyme I (PtsI)